MTTRPHFNCKSTVSRADLLRLSVLGGARALAQLASDLGYERCEPRLPPRDEPLPEIAFTTSPPPAPVWREPTTRWTAKFFAVTAKQHIRDPDAGGPAPPAWLINATAYGDDVRGDPGSSSCHHHLPLIRRSRLLPVLRRELGRAHRALRPDIPRLVSLITQGVVVREIPRDRRIDWSPRICVVLDCGERTVPFWDDFAELRRVLTRVRGQSGIDARILVDAPTPGLRFRRPHEVHTQAWRMPGPLTPLLLLSDLGSNASNPEVSAAWQRFLVRLSASDVKTVVLAPATLPPNRATPATARRPGHVGLVDGFSS